VFKLYKGLFASFILSFHGSVQMTLYQTGKNVFERSDTFTELTGSAFGVVSKLVASFALYPFNLIRSKQQQIRNAEKAISEDIREHSITSKKDYRTFITACRNVYETAGIRGYYQGVMPSLLRHIPSSALFFYTYECVLKKLNR
jgi:hypothetical protein